VASKLAEAATGRPPAALYERLFRWQLLRLAGREAEAADVLDSLDARVRATPGCFNCIAWDEGQLLLRRSEVAEARGEWSRAADLLRQGLGAGAYTGWLNLSDVSSVTRLGLLLVHQARPEGVALLQLVVDLLPGTPGAELARAALIQVGALREATPERIRRVYVDGLDDIDPRPRLAREILGTAPRSR